MLDTRLQIERATGCGAYVSGVDLAYLSANDAQSLKAALFEHGVLFFPRPSPGQHVVLAEKFAAIDINRFFPKVADWPMIAKVEKLPEQTKNIGGGWHTDHSYDIEPALGSILVAYDLPPTGGDTLFADLAAAFETPDAATKAEIKGLRAVHDSSTRQWAPGRGDQPELVAESAAMPKAAHPVVIRHPGSGKPVPAVNPGFTTRFDGLTPDESAPLLDRLYAHAIQPERVHRFVWEPGSVAFWDNRATWHFAKNDYHGHYRLMHRITLAGDALEAA